MKTAVESVRNHSGLVMALTASFMVSMKLVDPAAASRALNIRVSSNRRFAYVQVPAQAARRACHMWRARPQAAPPAHKGLVRHREWPPKAVEAIRGNSGFSRSVRVVLQSGR